MRDYFDLFCPRITCLFNHEPMTTKFKRGSQKHRYHYNHNTTSSMMFHIPVKIYWHCLYRDTPDLTECSSVSEFKRKRRRDGKKRLQRAAKEQDLFMCICILDTSAQG